MRGPSKEAPDLQQYELPATDPDALDKSATPIDWPRQIKRRREFRSRKLAWFREWDAAPHTTTEVAGELHKRSKI